MGMRLENAGIVVSTRVTEAGAGIGLFGWMSSINWIGLSGVLIALVGLFANLFYQRRRDRRERAEHEARMQALRDRCQT